MSVSKNALDQIDKVLALADSDHEGEALGSLRMARRMLMREGLSFTEVMQAAKRGKLGEPAPVFFSSEHVQLEAQIDQLHDEIKAHIVQNESLTGQIEFWRKRAFDLEQMLAMTQAETAKWRDMARETAERLWDLGQLAQADAFRSQDPAPEDILDRDDEEPLKATG